MAMLKGDFLLWADVLELTGLSETAIRRKMSKGQFPKNGRMLGRAGWPKSQIAQWMAEEKKGAGVC